MTSRIQVDPRVRFGRPCVAGTRITVPEVLALVRMGIPFEVVMRDYYPSLTPNDIQACVQHALAGGGYS